MIRQHLARRRYRRRLFCLPDPGTLAAMICLLALGSIILFALTLPLPDGLARDLVGDLATAVKGSS